MAKGKFQERLAAAKKNPASIKTLDDLIDLVPALIVAEAQAVFQTVSLNDIFSRDFPGIPRENQPSGEDRLSRFLSSLITRSALPQAAAEKTVAFFEAFKSHFSGYIETVSAFYNIKSLIHTLKDENKSGRTDASDAIVDTAIDVLLDGLKDEVTAWISDADARGKVLDGLTSAQRTKVLEPSEDKANFDAFKRIYEALRAGQKSLFKTNYLKKLPFSTDEDKIISWSEANKHAEKNSKSRTAKALKILSDYCKEALEPSHDSHAKLFQDIYIASFEASMPLARSRVSEGSKASFFATAVRRELEAHPMTTEEVAATDSTENTRQGHIAHVLRG